MPRAPMVDVPIRKAAGGTITPQQDLVAVEEPLELRLGYGPLSMRSHKSIAITMRTPGHDFELAAGFLLSEGIVAQREEIVSIRYCRDTTPQAMENVVRIELHPDVDVSLERVERNFYTTSSCGICGKASLEAVELSHRACAVKSAQALLDADTLLGLPSKLREAQAVFDSTGGLHAAALFDAAATLLALREDVGRHNAVDKLLGAQLLAGRTPLDDRLLLVSGRASFELMQKALLAGLPLLAAVGAPSSLAVELARQFNLTLIGFLRDGRFNIYAGEDRIGHPQATKTPAESARPARNFRGL